MIDFSSLQNALATFEVALKAHNDAPEDLIIRDACIQRFEYCFELSHKMLRRYLAQTEAEVDEVMAMSFPDLMRLAYARKLTSYEWRVWRGFRDVRNTTSHAYDAQKAALAMASFAQFFEVSNELLANLIRDMGV
jgi:nucleotidyltransferase substrate binding protein (TIGR01987 family)